VENIEVLVSKMPNLQELNIDETGIATLPPGLFYNNLKLKELNISANYLIHLDASGSDFMKKKVSTFSTHERN
jgi:Leucine-rich repeat (LRR) protein